MSIQSLTLPQNTHSYLPGYFSYEKKCQAEELAQRIHTAIQERAHIMFSYHNQTRIVTPVNLYTQESTSKRKDRIVDRGRGYPHKRDVWNEGARRAIAFDAYQNLKESNDERGWRSFHVDRVDNLQLLTRDEVITLLSPDRVKMVEDLIERDAPGYIRNWDYLYRTYLSQRDSRYDLR